MSSPILVLNDINKYFNEDFSLHNINLDLYEGEVHILMGENGSGKSAIMKIISGIFQPDSGEIILEGTPIHFSSAYDAKKYGIHYIMQDTNLYENFSVAENVFFDQMPYINKFLKLIDQNKMYYNCRILFNKLGIDIDPFQPVSQLGFGQKQLVELAKACVSPARLLILDEPSAALTESERKILFETITTLKEKGMAIFYISHKLDDVEKIGDRITVIHQGRIIDTRNVQSIDDSTVVKMMTGKTFKNRYPKLPPVIGEEILSVRNLKYSNILDDINFNLHKGEILGITGLVGSGRTLLAKCLFGMIDQYEGTVELDGEPVNFSGPADAIAAGIILVPEDRLINTVIGCLSLRENLSIASLKRFARGPILYPTFINTISLHYIKNLNIKPGNPEDLFFTYSGGNQQKTILGRAIMTRPRIYILDEPTRGIDIASKVDIYNIMNDIVTNEGSIIFISSDIEEILGMCDRILVLTDGKISYEMSREEATKEKILYHAIKKAGPKS